MMTLLFFFFCQLNPKSKLLKKTEQDEYDIYKILLR